MNWPDHFRRIDLETDEIDLDDGTFLIPCYADSGPLIESIRRVGIVNPPAVRRRPTGGFVPVLGRRRLRAAKSLGVSHITAWEVPGSMPDPDGFTLAFWDNCGLRPLESAFVSFMVKRLLDLFPVEAVAREFLPALGVEAQGPRLERLRAVGGLEDPLLRALGRGRLWEKTAVLMTHLTSEERLALFGLAERLNLNANKTHEVIGGLFDVGVFSGRSVLDLPADDRIRRALDDPDSTTPERASAVRRAIRELKFPDLVEKERLFQSWEKSLPSAHGVRVSPTAGFEDDRITVRVTAENLDHAAGIVARIVDESG